MNFIEKLNIAHNVECPVCGTKASYILTGKTTFKTETCAHDEVIKLVDDRLHSVLILGINPDSNKPLDNE